MTIIYSTINSLRQRRQNESALGDNNCAFNAFALGLCQVEILDDIEARFAEQQKDPNLFLKEFITAVANKFNLQHDWQRIKKHLLDLRQKDKKKLQKSLAPILRELAIQQAKKDEQHYYRMLPSFLSTFRNYIYEKARFIVTGEKDDIYHRHPYIYQYFDILYNTHLKIQIENAEFSTNKKEYNRLNQNKIRSAEENNILTQVCKQLDAQIIPIEQQYLIPWWENNGYGNFLQEMAQDGAWSGDLELAQLGRYFDINLNIKRRDFTYQMNIAHGKLPRMSTIYKYELQDHHVKQLVDRGIIDKPLTNHQEKLALLPLTQKQFQKRLRQVPNYKKVRKFIAEHKENLKQQKIPQDWSKACVDELAQRDVIDATKKCFIIGSKRARQRIKAIPHKENLESAWQAVHQNASTVTLSNENGIHWDNTVTIDVKSKNPSSKICKKTSLYTETLNMLSFWKPDLKSSWEELVKNVEELPVASEQSIAYTIENKVIHVSKEKQIELDEALAKKLQFEEYKKFNRRV